jgi:peptidyl-prolyl cis-trans isomerase C
MTARRWIVRGLAGVVATATLAGLVRAQGSVTPPPPTAPKVAAFVRGEPISMADVDAILKRNPMPTEPTALQRKQMQLEAVGMLVDNLLMQQFLRKNAPPVDPNLVNKQLAELIEDLKKKSRTLADYLHDTGQTEAELRTNIQNILQWAEYVKAHTSEADLRRYYDENKDFFDKVTVRASHIVIRVPATAEAAKLAADREAARTKLLALRQEIVAGKLDFAEAAKKHSQCSSAPQGGDLGYFSRKWMLEEPLAKAAFVLKVGDVSDVIQTEYGMHLIKVTDRKPGQPSEYEKIKDDVREFYIKELELTVLTHERKEAEAKGQIQINVQ